jgi:hypothetical protein
MSRIKKIVFSVFLFSATLILILFFGVKWGSSNVLIDDLDELGIKINAGNNFRIEARNPVGDFTLYHLTLREETMTIYVGNHPNFPNNKSIESVMVGEGFINEVRVKYYLKSSENGCSSEYLFDFSSDLYFPQFLHIMFTNVSVDALGSFQRVINSIERGGSRR